MNWTEVISLIESLLPSLLSAVDTVEKATGKPPHAAAQEVVDHLTPGQPNSPTLTNRP
jgi:hypothetical protein